MATKTLLGAAAQAALAQPEAPTAREDRERGRQLVDRAAAFAVDGWLAAYESGHVSLEQLLRGACAVADALLDDSDVRSVLPGGRPVFVGILMTRANEISPRKARKQEFPVQFRLAATELLYLVKEREGLSIEDGYERVAAIFRGGGVEVDATRIETWHDSNSRKPRKG